MLWSGSVKRSMRSFATTGPRAHVSTTSNSEAVASPAKPRSMPTMASGPVMGSIVWVGR